MNFFPLYIDPGTGSALFSILIGVAATVYFLGRAVIIKLKTVFFRGKNVSITEDTHRFVIYSEGKQYSNLFKPILEECEKRGIDILFLSSSNDDPLFAEPFAHIKSEYIGEGNRAFSRLNLLRAEFVLMTTPGLDVYQLKRSKGVKHYSHILHAATDATTYRLFGLDYFDSVLLTGDYQKDDIRTLEAQRNIPQKQLVTVGCPYLDVFADKIKQLPVEESHQFTVLVSPSWGPSAILSRYGEKLLDPLISSGLKTIIRPHPQSKKSEADILDRLSKKYQDNTNLEWDFSPENIHSLHRADIMLSDFSGIIFDYAFLFNKPIIYANSEFDIRIYDADDLGDNAKDTLWQFKTLKEIGIELREEDFFNIAEIIRKAAENEEKREARTKARNTAWQFPGEAGKKIVDFITGQYHV